MIDTVFYDSATVLGKVLAFVLFAVGLVLVVKGGDWFVDAASWIARAAKIPTFIIGATIVSFATTLPEMIVSVTAIIKGEPGCNDMAIGNAVGSVTANTAMIMALALIFMAVTASRKRFLEQFILLIASASFLWVGCFQKNAAGEHELQLWACIVLFIIFVVFMVYNVQDARQGNSELEGAEEEEEFEFSKKGMVKQIVMFIIGALAIVAGSTLLIDHGTVIAQDVFKVPERIVAITLVAIGTSLPELVTTVTAIRKKEANLSVGNIVGANIIDLSLILPICKFVAMGKENGTGTAIPFTIPLDSFRIDMPLCLGVTLIAIVPMLIKQKGYKAQGIAMLAVYAVYIGFSAVRAFAA